MLMLLSQTQEHTLNIQRNEPLARYTTARIGGPADFFSIAHSYSELQALVQLAWEQDIPLLLLGAGSNVLISESGFRGLVVLNRTRQVEITATDQGWCVLGESGIGLPTLARLCEQRGLGGLEWAATVPGTLGGAIFGNAGAYGQEIADHVELVTFLHRDRGLQTKERAELEFGYRSSWFKKVARQNSIILNAKLNLPKANPADIASKISTFQMRRRRAQPPGASFGSMFKNPPGDYAGRLIEAAGLKGLKIGEMQISEIHANFFINCGHATSQQVMALIEVAQKTVWQKFGVKLELEIELVGEM
jgi:UDP-N-acetylmuramate dehydrogenase